jgi:predicted transcriptional regulator
MVTLTLRLDDDTAQVLREQADTEHRSMNDVAILAIRDRSAFTARREHRTALIGQLIEENHDLLERLSR